MKCYRCKASYYYGYKYPVQECIIETLSEPVMKDDGCDLHYKTINRVLKELEEQWKYTNSEV